MDRTAPTPPANALAPDLPEDIAREAIAFRRRLHGHPELDLHLPRTQAAVLERLEALRAFDLFSRNVASGWGTADVGGAWSGTTGFSVADGVGVVSVPATVTRVTSLPGSVGDASATFTVAT